jgi:hypothetical protein
MKVLLVSHHQNWHPNCFHHHLCQQHLSSLMFLHFVHAFPDEKSISLSVLKQENIFFSISTMIVALCFFNFLVPFSDQVVQ